MGKETRVIAWAGAVAIIVGVLSMFTGFGFFLGIALMLAGGWMLKKGN